MRQENNCTILFVFPLDNGLIVPYQIIIEKIEQPSYSGGLIYSKFAEPRRGRNLKLRDLLQENLKLFWFLTEHYDAELILRSIVDYIFLFSKKYFRDNPKISEKCLSF